MLIKKTVSKKLVKKELKGIKILGNGKLEKKLTIKANVFTNSAINKIEDLIINNIIDVSDDEHCSFIKISIGQLFDELTKLTVDDLLSARILAIKLYEDLMDMTDRIK